MGHRCRLARHDDDAAGWAPGEDWDVAGVVGVDVVVFRVAGVVEPVVAVGGEDADAGVAFGAVGL